MRRNPLWRAVSGARGKGSGVRKQEPRGRTICPERSGAEGETKGPSLWRAEQPRKRRQVKRPPVSPNNTTKSHCFRVFLHIFIK